MDLISHGTLHVQTCISVQIFEGVDPGIPAPPELVGMNLQVISAEMTCAMLPLPQRPESFTTLVQCSCD